MSQKNNKFSVLELCAGGGGQFLGLEHAGFHCVGAVEIEGEYCHTLLSNRPALRKGYISSYMAGMMARQLRRRSNTSTCKLAITSHLTQNDMEMSNFQPQQPPKQESAPQRKQWKPGEFEAYSRAETRRLNEIFRQPEHVAALINWLQDAEQIPDDRP